MTWLYIDNHRVSVEITCNKSLAKESTFKEESWEDKHATLQQVWNKKEKLIYINCWVNNVLVFSYTLTFLEGQKYSIEYSFKTKESTLTKQMHPKVAKALFNTIKKSNLVSPPVWDPVLEIYDWKCKACNYSWVGNPDIGYVVPYKPSNLEEMEKAFIECKGTPKPFFYNGIWYQGIPYKNYNRLKFFNKKEYEDEMKKLSYKKYKKFEEIWNFPLTDEEIAEDKNSIGGAWKLKDGGIISNTAPVYLKEGTEAEKVVTLGWHGTVLSPNAESCPVCKDLYSIICKSGYVPLTFFQKIKARSSCKIYNWKKSLKVKISNFFHNRKKKNENNL